MIRSRAAVLVCYATSVVVLGSCSCSASHEPGDGGLADARVWADAGVPRVYDECDPARERPRPEITARRAGCATHDECADGPNGRCVRAGPDFVCTYDECFGSDDCGPGARCACDTGPALQNLCLRADCRGPEDCEGLGCDVSYECMGPGEVDYSAVRFLCHTPADTCRSDADCGAFELCTRGPFPASGPTLDYWRCEMPACG